MILGQTPDQRLPYSRPGQAGFFTPHTPMMSFYSHLRPFATMSPIQAVSGRIPQGSKYMNPGIATARASAMVAQDADQAQVVTAMTPTAPGMAGFGNAGVDPYAVMRSGVLPGIRAAGNRMRYGIQSAGALIRRQSPGAYPAVNNPAGGHALAPGNGAQPTPAPVAGWW